MDRSLNKCILCKEESVVVLLNLGGQPICNRFLEHPEDNEYLHPMIFGQCGTCGVAQIVNPVPSAELLPKYGWVSYNEPEEHLDDLSDIINRLPGVTADSTACGISFKDDTFLVRLNNLGLKHTWRIDPRGDLGIFDAGIGVETIQSRLTHKAANGITYQRGKADIVVVRHILEHVHDLPDFMKAIHQLLRPGGYAIFEVPDCMRRMQCSDITVLWEEHVSYFTPETFRHCLEYYGFSPIRLECYPHTLEDSLVGIAQKSEKSEPPSQPKDILAGEIDRAKAFCEGAIINRDRYKNTFAKYREDNVKIAMFGAGQHACEFINLLRLKDCIEFVVEDNPNKQGLYMPGSRLPIRAPDSLIQENIGLCLFGFNPSSEDVVIQNNEKFISHGGIFASIFASSRRALRVPEINGD